MKEHEIVAGLDIGATKICLALGRRTQTGVSFLGAGVAPCNGVKRGIPVNVGGVARAIHEAAQAARTRTGCEIPPVFLNVPRLRARPQQSATGELDELDARGQMRVLLECVERAELEVADLVPSAVASASGVLSAEDKARGVALVDIGASLTSVAVYVRGALVRACSLPVGGLYITADICQGLRVSLHEAQRVKHVHGDVLMRAGYEQQEIELASVGGRPAHTCTRAEMVAVIAPRVTEILLGVSHTIRLALLGETLDAGLVLCGGTARLSGIAQLGEQLLNVPVRVARPLTAANVHGSILDSPEFAAVVGLLTHIKRRSRTAPPSTPPSPAHAWVSSAVKVNGRWM